MAVTSTAQDKKPASYGSSWRESALALENGEYHIINDGVLTRRDCSLLFSDKQGKTFIPIEAVKQLNVYSNVKISPGARTLLSRKGVRVVFFSTVGNVEGCYTPLEHAASAAILLTQCRLYDNPKARLSLAREFENAALRNMLAAVRYYHRRGRGDYAAHQQEIQHAIAQVSACQSVDKLMLCEAKARRAYYRTFDSIINGSRFRFGGRSKRPPLNEVNALISFGNAMLYSKFLQLLWRCGLDPRIGVVHAATSRPASLNLDFADVYKPVIVDRTVFALVNRREISAGEHFRREGKAVLLNEGGKRLFVQKVNKKLASRLTARGRSQSYEELMTEDVRRFRDALMAGERYAPSRFR